MENNFASIEAIYTPQRVPHYRDNPLIEALPPALNDDELLESLFCVPEFSLEQRSWTKSERLQMIAQLSSFMVPMDRHIQLAHSIDTLMRQGYIGRAPRSAASQLVFTKLYQNLKAGKTFQSSEVPLKAQLSAALIGLSGMGKTTTIRRILLRFPEVIYHPALGLHQIPYLHIETPYDGASVRGLAESIFRKVDQLLPDTHYGEQYSSSRSGADVLMNHAATVLHMHKVGLLVVDEIQNMENSPKTRQSLMTLLVSASNELGVPILFMGTNKAQNLLSMDFRQARRSVSISTKSWGKLAKGAEAAPDEWEDFLSVLWRFQWVKSPTPLTPAIADVMHHYSQGIIDIAIKLFALAQARAIHDESETVDGALLESVAHQELSNVLPMVDALRRNDITALARYEDIAPLASLDNMMTDMASRYSGRQVFGASIMSDNPQFAPVVAQALTTVGFDLAQAQALAEEVSSSPNALEGVKNALAHATSGPKRKTTRSQKTEQPKSYPPGDYRNALNPDAPDTATLERLHTLGMVANVGALLDI